MPKRTAGDAGLASGPDDQQKGTEPGKATWTPLTPEEMKAKGRKMLTIKKSVLAMRKPEAEAPASPAAATPAVASDASASPAPPAKKPAFSWTLPTSTTTEKKDGEKEGEKKEGEAGKAAVPWSFKPASDASPFTFKPPASGSSSAPFSFATTTKSPASFSFTPAATGDGKEGAKSMFATWAPPSSGESGAAFNPLKFNSDSSGDSIFGANGNIKKGGTQTPSGEPIPTGEEDEETAFTTRGKVFSMVANEDGTKRWRERGRGPLRINVHKETKKARILMRMDGTLQVKVNMVIFADMAITKVNDTNIVVHGFEGDMEPVSYLLKVRMKQECAELLEALEAQKKLAAANKQEEKKEEGKPEEKKEETKEETKEEKAEEKTEEKKETAEKTEEKEEKPEAVTTEETTAQAS